MLQPTLLSLDDTLKKISDITIKVLKKHNLIISKTLYVILLTQIGNFNIMSNN